MPAQWKAARRIRAPFFRLNYQLASRAGSISCEEAKPYVCMVLDHSFPQLVEGGFDPLSPSNVAQNAGQDMDREDRRRIHTTGNYLILSNAQRRIADWLIVDNRSRCAAEVAHMINPSRLSTIKWLRDGLNGAVSSSMRFVATAAAPRLQSAAGQR